MKNNIRLAIKNIYSFGDTDVFPYITENFIFRDKASEICGLVEEIHNSFEELLSKTPPVNVSCCSPLGYSAFRWVTQIDPLWNAYFLSLAIDIAESIEKARIPKEENTIFSYRYSPDIDKGSLFDEKYNWKAFQEESLKIAENDKYTHVLLCDISDFYLRIYHHKLENALQRLNIPTQSAKRIICSKSPDLLSAFSDTASFGLPIGGPAARILAELALNDIDRYLLMRGIKFVRFVDDYHIFGRSLSELHRLLNELTRHVQNTERLSIQKSKTQILTKNEFISLTSKHVHTASESEKFRFLSLPIHFDPYSDTPEEDYNDLKDAINKFDVIGLLFEELRKQKIHAPYGKKLVKAFVALDKDLLQSGVKLIADNLPALLPIIPQAMMAINSTSSDIDETTFEYLFDRILQLITENSHVLTNELNSAFILKAISNRHSTSSEMIATRIAEIHNGLNEISRGCHKM